MLQTDRRGNQPYSQKWLDHLSRLTSASGCAASRIVTAHFEISCLRHDTRSRHENTEPWYLALQVLSTHFTWLDTLINTAKHMYSLDALLCLSCVLRLPRCLLYTASPRLHGSRTVSSGSVGLYFYKPLQPPDASLELDGYLILKTFTPVMINEGHAACIPPLGRKRTLEHENAQHGEERKNESPSSSAPPHFQECRAQLPLDFPRAAAIAGPHGSSAVAGNDSEPEMISAASSPAQVAERKS